jgi:hypothetical protein
LKRTGDRFISPGTEVGGARLEAKNPLERTGSLVVCGCLKSSSFKACVVAADPFRTHRNITLQFSSSHPREGVVGSR